MIVAGLQKLSLVDYPGKLAAVVFLQGCNFRCGYCQNPDLISKEGVSRVQEREVFEYLTNRKDKLEAVVITGGEPTIHRELGALLKKIALTGLKIKLDTNGSNPLVVRELIAENLLDYIALDIKTSFSKYSMLSPEVENSENIAESVRLCLESTVPYELRTTCVPGIINERDIRDIAVEVKGAKKYCLQQFRPGITLDPAFAGVKPFKLSDVERFARILSEHVEEVELRGF